MIDLSKACTEIAVAVIGVVGMIIVAIINGRSREKTSKGDRARSVDSLNRTSIKQTVHGDHNTVIGMQNNETERGK